MFSCSIITKSSRNFQHLINLANSPRTSRSNEHSPSLQNYLVASNKTSSSIQETNSNDNAKDVLLFWPNQITLTGSVILANAKYEQQRVNSNFTNNNNNNNNLNIGDVRIRRKYFAGENSFPNEIFADQGLANSSSTAFSLEAKSRSGGRRSQNKFHQEESPFFESVEDFGMKFHQLNGHEYVYMQNVHERKLNDAPAGCLLVDVWVVPEMIEPEAPTKGMQQQNRNQKFQAAGFWAKLCGTNSIVGVPDSSFRSGDGELVMEGRFNDLLKKCKGVTVNRHRSKKSRGSESNLRIDPMKIFHGYFFDLEKPNGSMNQSWMSSKSLKR